MRYNYVCLDTVGKPATKEQLQLLGDQGFYLAGFQARADTTEYGPTTKFYYVFVQALDEPTTPMQ